jgi:F-type H+-transporting ATPase subunit epsilon
MASLSFQLVTPERTLLNEELDSLSVPTELGQITVLPGHIPLVATLMPGELIGRSKGAEHFIHVAGGFLEVRSGNEVVILADAAEHFYEIDIKLAEEAKAKAEETMKRRNTLSDEEYARVAVSLERSLSRLNIARKHAHRRTAPITGEGVRKE